MRFETFKTHRTDVKIPYSAGLLVIRTDSKHFDSFRNVSNLFELLVDQILSKVSNLFETLVDQPYKVVSHEFDCFRQF